MVNLNILLYNMTIGDTIMDKNFMQSLEILKEKYKQLNWQLTEITIRDKTEKMFLWPGRDNEDIIIVVKGNSDELQQFHRHEYFYFNYAFSGQQDMLSLKYDRRVTMRQGDIYAGQPFAGHAAVPSSSNVLTVSILIRPEVLFQSFLPSLSGSADMVNFLLNPATDSFSQEVIHFNAIDDMQIRKLIELMVSEYADDKADVQTVLKPLVLAFLLQISRYYQPAKKRKRHNNISADIIRYINGHITDASLKGIADEFGYHPNYVCAILKKETGKTFSRLLLEQRMERAVALLKSTNMAVENISAMVGYSNPSNFHKAFKEYYNKSPREYLKVEI